MSFRIGVGASSRHSSLASQALRFVFLLTTCSSPRQRGTLSQIEPVSISQSSPSSSPLEKPSGTQPVERLLRDLDAQWAKAAAAKDVEQTIGYYSDDAIVLPPNATSAATKEAIRNVWKDMFASPGLAITWEPTKVQLAKSGDMAWVSGSVRIDDERRER